MRWVASLSLAIALLVPASASAITLEPVGTFESPTYVTSLPDDPDRLLVVELSGRVQLVDGDATSVFLDATALVGEIEAAQGMWSIALAPDFATTGRLYAAYAGSATGGDFQLDEFTAVGNTVDLATRRPVLTFEHSDRPRHYGGQLQFGPDGYLYLTTGDGDTQVIRAQQLTSPNGKLLRIDPRQAGEAPYSVPADNPFAGAPPALPEIWSLGLRNPYRFSFDRQTGALAIGDVGRARFEEVDYDDGPQPGRGDNYGWPCFEADEVRNTTNPPCTTIDPANVVFPIHDYSHDFGCSITGGYVARDPELGDLFGRYLYADLCTGEIRSLIPQMPQASGDRFEGVAVSQPVSFGEDACGRLYVVSITGPVSRLVGDDPSDCGDGEVAVSGGVLTVDAVAGVRNRIEVTPSGSGAEWVVRDHMAPLVAGSGCTQLRPSRVRCPKAGVESLAVATGRVNDRVTTPDGLDARVVAGTGDDLVTTGAGADSLAGGSGRDILDGGHGPDVLDGGPNQDTVSYELRGAAEPVEVDVDGAPGDDGGAADDGGADTRDTVRANVENVKGGAGADSITGSDGPNRLTGGPGADQLHGLGANDTIQAEDGGVADAITCGAGPADRVFADPADTFPLAGPDACELTG